MQKRITLTVNGVELHFDVTLSAYDRYINELQPTNKVAPARNFLSRTVCAESREALASLQELPGAVVQLAGTVLMEYTPDLEITVGK